MAQFYKIIIKNLRRYPVRTRVGTDEQGGGVYRVLPPFKTYGPVEVSQELFDILRASVNVQVISA